MLCGEVTFSNIEQKAKIIFMFLADVFRGSPIPSWLLPMLFKLYYQFPLLLLLEKKI